MSQRECQDCKWGISWLLLIKMQDKNHKADSFMIESTLTKMFPLCLDFPGFFVEKNVCKYWPRASNVHTEYLKNSSSVKHGPPLPPPPLHGNFCSTEAIHVLLFSAWFLFFHTNAWSEHHNLEKGFMYVGVLYVLLVFLCSNLILHCKSCLSVLTAGQLKGKKVKSASSFSLLLKMSQVHLKVHSNLPYYKHPLVALPAVYQSLSQVSQSRHRAVHH